MTGIAGLAYGAFDFQPRKRRLGSRKDGTNRTSTETRLWTELQSWVPRALNPPLLGPARHPREAGPKVAPSRVAAVAWVRG